MPVIRRISAHVEVATNHSEDTRSLILQPDEAPPGFRPGQFLHLALDQYDSSSQWPESRVFSIANSPTRSPKIRITFSAKGPFTKRMLREAVPGAKVWLKLPYGSFTLEDNGRPKALIAGGTGITPFVSFLEYAVDTKVHAPINLFYGVRSPDLLLYRELIEECTQNVEHFVPTIFVEQGLGVESPYRTGRLNIEQIVAELTHEDSVDYYLSGPFEMVKSFKSALLLRNIEASRILIDDWG
jgi:ferredoxin-NADP reductase